MQGGGNEGGCGRGSLLCGEARNESAETIAHLPPTGGARGDCTPFEVAGMSRRREVHAPGKAHRQLPNKFVLEGFKTCGIVG